MKKSVVGMAALCASAVSFAQTSAASTRTSCEQTVKIYGVADLGLAHYRPRANRKPPCIWRLRFAPRLFGRRRPGAGTGKSTRAPRGRREPRHGHFELHQWQRQPGIQPPGLYRDWKTATLGALRLGRQQGPTYTFFPTYDPMLLPSMDAWGVLSTLGSHAPGTAIRHRHAIRLPDQSDGAHGKYDRLHLAAHGAACRRNFRTA